MKLKTVKVTHFRSVENSETFEVDDVTCLVGKNEAGKSALLLALAGLNPHESTPVIYDKERDYPRAHLTDYDENHPIPATVVQTSWQLEQDELDAISEIVGGNGLSTSIVDISRRYDRDIKVEAKINYKRSLSNIYQKYDLSKDDMNLLADGNTSTAVIKLLETIEDKTPELQKLASYFKENGDFSSQVTALVKRFLPKILYFSSYDRMDGAIQIEQTKNIVTNGQIDSAEENSGAKLFLEFMDYAGVSLDEISTVETYETFNAKLQAASNKITDQILEYWTQNPFLEVRVSIDKAMPKDPAPFNTGTVARAKIYNTLHRADTPFSERSAGFVWFFSFFVKFSQVKTEDKPVLILFDEPGLTLHGKAQADLLRFFDEVLASKEHQLIYSTHSPFMVPADKLSKVRIVEDLVDSSGSRAKPIGTKVRDNVLSTDPDTLFPLQGALGYEITQSLFIGKNTLLVEGPGDILYIQALSEALIRKKRVGLSSNWTICPAGGIDKIEPFVALFAGNDALNVAALSDQATGDKKKVDRLKNSEILKAGNFHTMADFLNRAEADIEDIFEPEIFASLLNSCYGLKGGNKLTKSKLANTTPKTDRLLKQAESAFKLMPPDIPEFDHFSPASWLIRNPGFLEKDTSPLSETLDRAEIIFDQFNKLL